LRRDDAGSGRADIVWEQRYRPGPVGNGQRFDELLLSQHGCCWFQYRVSTSIVVGGVQFDVGADLQPVLEPRIALVVGLHIVTNAFSPDLIFTFSNIAFTPAAIVTGITNEPGSTSGIWAAPSLLSPTSVQLATHPSFLSNGGALQGSFALVPSEAPEPATGGLVFLAGSAIVRGAIFRRRPTFNRSRYGVIRRHPILAQGPPHKFSRMPRSSGGQRLY